MTKKLFKLKSFSLILLIFAILITFTACDTIQDLTTYSINVEITGLEEDDSENLSISYNGEVADQLTYDEDEEIFKATLTNLRGTKEITPNLTSEEFYNAESYSNSLKISSSDDGRTIKFNATQVIEVETNIQSEIDDANPGDTLEIYLRENTDDLNINTTGLRIKGITIQDTIRKIAGAQITITANDITIENFEFIEGAELSANDTSKTKILSNIFNDNLHSAITLNNNNSTINDNRFNRNNIGISATNNSSIDLDNNHFESNTKNGIQIINSQALLSNNDFINNEIGLEGDSSQIEIKDNNNFRSNVTGIKITNGEKTLIQNNAKMENNAIAIHINGGEAAKIINNNIQNNQQGLQITKNNSLLENNSIQYNTVQGIKTENTSNLKVTKNNISNNEVGLILEDSFAEITFNTFEAIRNGIMIFGESSVANTQVNDNNFMFFSERAIVALKDRDLETETTAALNAKDNYWHNKDTIEEIKELLIGYIEPEPFRENKIDIEN